MLAATQSAAAVPPKTDFETWAPKRQRMPGKTSPSSGLQIQLPQASGKRREFDLKKGKLLPARGRGWFARPLLAASFLAEPNGACHARGGRGFAPAAPHRQADCCRGRRVAGDRQAHPAASGPQSALGPRAGRARASLRAPPSRRAHPHRHQETRQVQRLGPGEGPSGSFSPCMCRSPAWRSRHWFSACPCCSERSAQELPTCLRLVTESPPCPERALAKLVTCLGG